MDQPPLATDGLHQVKHQVCPLHGQGSAHRGQVQGAGDTGKGMAQTLEGRGDNIGLDQYVPCVRGIGILDNVVNNGDVHHAAPRRILACWMRRAAESTIQPIRSR
jgi:hypothetical protein